ncbi:signal peptidase I [uncultured Jatrophihabitans sp.]|uniref:signal peptidase I n=1 Tax=uncultured Jatrophihabitans sp. TaxID=1610747 RepID=UPI0035CC23E1
MTSTTNRRFHFGVAACALLMITAGVLVSSEFGGMPKFVTTHGTSMEPRFHTGDLGVLRHADSYHVGDIAAYHSTTLHTIVMHRIVKIQDGRYTFKGDNNSWLDPAPAKRSQLVGTLAVRVPHGGIVLEDAKRLLPFALAAIVLLAGTGVAATQRRRGRRSKHSSRSASGSPLSGLRISPDLATAAAITAVVAVLGVFLGVKGLTGADTPAADVVARTAPAPADAKTVLTYSAHVGRTAAYDRTTVTAPTPIFRKVTNLVDLTAAYTGPAGRFTMTADLSTQAGWHSTMVLAPATTFTGARIIRTVPMDLRALDRRAQAAAASTGIPADSMGIDVTATVARPGEQPFSSVLHLTMTPLELSMTGTAATLVHRSGETPTAPTATPRSRPGTIKLFGLQLASGTVLIIAAVVLAGCALSVAALLFRARTTRRASEGDAIRRRYSALLVPVEPIKSAAGRPTVDVPEMATLAKIAERYGLLVLHWSRAGVETFVVQDENTTYRYRVTGPATASHGGGAHRSSPRPVKAAPLDNDEDTLHPA